MLLRPGEVRHTRALMWFEDELPLPLPNHIYFLHLTRDVQKKLPVPYSSVKGGWGYLLGTFILCQRRANSHFFGGSQLWVQCSKISFPRGGGYIGRFRNVWVRGGGVTWSHF